MGEIILAAVIGVLAFAGIIGVISALVLSFYHVNGGAGECIVLPVSGHIDDIEFCIRGAVARRQRVSRHAKIFLADFGADAETAEIARRMCGEFEGIEWVECDKLAECLRKNILAQNKK